MTMIVVMTMTVVVVVIATDSDNRDCDGCKDISGGCDSDDESNISDRDNIGYNYTYYQKGKLRKERVLSPNSCVGR